jgi:predicted nuclease with TOPRIM domain
MSDIRLTQDKMKTFTDENKGAFKTSARLESFGEKQNAANEVLAANVNDLIKRVCRLEDQQIKNNEIMKRLAGELSSLKAELDRQKLTTKLNSNTIDRLNNAIKLASNSSEE